MIDYRLALATGADIPVPECQLILHQPSIVEISYIGELCYYTGAQCLCLNKSMYVEDERLLEQITNFEIFITLMQEKEMAQKKEDTLQTLSLLFPGYKIGFTPRSIFFNKDGETFMVDDNNFEFLQNILSKVFCLSDAGQQAFNPGNDAAKKIADKLMKAREKVAKQKGDNPNGSALSQYVSVLTVGLGSMSLQDCINLTVYQLYDLVERYGLYVNWDIDLRSRLAGGKPDSQPENWMKNIH